MASPGGSESLRLRTGTGSVPLGFAREPGVVYLVARERAARWPVELLRNGRADLALPDGGFRGTPRLVSDRTEQARVLGLFREKYGPSLFERWYDHPARVLRVSLDHGGPAGGPGTDHYYEWLESEFDNVAEEYDRHITGNRMNRLLRARSLAWLEPRFATAHRLLEIGCGSGMETLPLLQAGHEIVAVDISERMLATVRAKAEREGVGNRLVTRHLRARDLDHLSAELGDGSLDGAYSTYGALNCEPDLSPIPHALGRLLKPGAPFVAGVYNRWCLFEMAGYSASLQARRAFGRRQNPVPVGSSRFCVDIYAHSVADFRRLFHSGFTVERVEGVPVLLPPSDLAPYAEKFSRRFDRLAGWDARVGRHWPFNGLGDHFLMTFVREP
ncbi:MAG: methyltransferase domain-containing protein [Thermoplasmata archaeon]|nr:methyltransferase domain-containing protein [Thermoplasmata archaeon]